MNNRHKLLNIDHWVASNGAKVYFVQRKQLPIVDIEIIFNAGSAFDADQWGVSYLTNVMLNQGTCKLTADELATKFDNLGAEFGIDSDRDSAKIGLRTLSSSKYLEPAIELMRQVVCEPRFQQCDFIRMKDLVLRAIRYQAQTPEMQAKNAFFESIYQSHPYAHSILGTLESVSKITNKDIKLFYRSFYIANNATINIVGNLTIKQAASIADTVLKGLTKSRLMPRIQSVTAVPPANRVVQFPSEQAHILIGQVGVSYDHRDYLPLLVGNDILGGSGLTSQLYYTIRERHGLAYSAHSTLASLKGGGQFIIAMQTRIKHADNAIQMARKLYANFLLKGPTDAQLKSSKKKLQHSYLLPLSQNSSVLSMLARFGMYQLPLTYLDDVSIIINALTVREIRSAFRLHLPLEQMSIIVVGSSVK